MGKSKRRLRTFFSVFLKDTWTTAARLRRIRLPWSTSWCRNSRDADNHGNLIPNSTNSAYAIFIYTNNAVPGFTDPASANLVTVRVAWPANAPAANQTFRDYVRIISKY